MSTMPAKMFNQFICSSLMLPEHREALNRHNRVIREQGKKQHPCIDEQERELWDHLISESLRKGRKLAVTYLEKNAPRVLRGVICSFEPLGRKFVMDAGGMRYPIPLSSIIAIEKEALL